MIHAITANAKSFRTVQFDVGVNVILADRSAKASDKDTTNALGKSTLIDIIDFCLGCNFTASHSLKVDALQDWSFTLSLTLAAHKLTVTRSVGSPNFIAIEGDTSRWPFKPQADKKSGLIGLDVKKWRRILGWAMFGLSASANDDDDEGYEPSPRSLLSYFIRSQPAAYIDPFKYFANQKTWDIQLHNTFLLGLDWKKASKWQVLKDRKNALDALRNAIKTGAIDGELGTLGELEAQRVQLEGQVEEEKAALSSFQVLPQYRQIELNANRLTAQIHSLVNANVADRRRIERYQENVSAEDAPHDSKLEAMYKDAGVSLPGAVTKTLEDAREFNRKIVENRKQFVLDEIAQLAKRCDARDTEIASLSEERAKNLSVLAGHGALEELTLLQERHATTSQLLETSKHRIAQLRQMSTRANEIKGETVELKKSAEVDYEERRALWSKALKMFSDHSNALYKASGKLVIDIDDTGYKFHVDIPGSPSEGISKMKIFCYDLMLAAFSRSRGLGVDVLIHDSTIFDGVDPRQRAHAIELAAALSKQFGFQYILTLNTDMVPVDDFTPNFAFDELVRLRLTDTDASGSLLGIRY
jgi:uncharacterized protein YydD (DUF2326 family)